MGWKPWWESAGSPFKSASGSVRSSWWPQMCVMKPHPQWDSIMRIKLSGKKLLGVHSAPDAVTSAGLGISCTVRSKCHCGSCLVHGLPLSTMN